MSFVTISLTVVMNGAVIVLTFGMIRFTILYGGRKCVIFALTPPLARLRNTPSLCAIHLIRLGFLFAYPLLSRIRRP